MGTEVVTARWGTWEELLLGGAVLRHGTRDWNLVAAELRARSHYPFTFTPEVCKAKYEDLRKRYSGCTAWFEELRKKRMAELRKALEQSEDSIGSLETKLESLKAEKKGCCLVDYDSSRTESPVPFQKSEGVEYTSKDTSKDLVSAGSFTQQTQMNWSTECQIQAAVPADTTETKLERSPPNREKALSNDTLTEPLCGGQLVSTKKRRGKRKRKDCSRDVKEASVGESDFLGSTDIASASMIKENSTSNSGQLAGSSGIDDQSRGSTKAVTDDLMRIYNSVAQNDCASVFRRRLDSQKRGRYKKLVLCHMDFDTIRSRIMNHSISSPKELFRDLLLLANNALVFYSKSTREHKSAALLREIITKTLHRHLKECGSKPNMSTLLSGSAMQKPPAKPRSARPGGSHKPSGKVATAENHVARTPDGGKKQFSADSPPSVESLAMLKKGAGRPRKVSHERHRQTSEIPVTGRKRCLAN